MNIQNKKIILKSRPVGLPSESCWSIETSPIVSPGEGEILVRIIYVSVDPAMRGWINDVPSYIPPVAVGETMRALGVAQVVSSNSAEYKSGDYVCGMFGVQQYAVLCPDASTYKVESEEDKLAMHLSVLGMPGMTAYFGLTEIGMPRTGDTVLVSGAAGAVGSLVGQISKYKGCRVVGIAGGAEKCRYLVESLGFDEAIDYKSMDDLEGAIHMVCPQGVDVFFDNVGGDILDAAILNLCKGARIVACGAISQYNEVSSTVHKIDYLPILFSSSRLEGFVILDYQHRYSEGICQMSEWLESGVIKNKEDIYEGIEEFPNVLLKLFNGENFGKLVLKVNDDSSI